MGNSSPSEHRGSGHRHCRSRGGHIRGLDGVDNSAFIAEVVVAVGGGGGGGGGVCGSVGEAVAGAGGWCCCWRCS